MIRDRKKQSISWYFPPTGGGIEQGFNHPGRESFKGRDIWNNVIRELVQNSLDATSGSKPVHIKMGTFDISPAQIGGSDLAEHIKIMLKDAKDEEISTAQEICNAALKVIKSKKLPVFYLIDSNTIGLKQKNFDALVYREGISKKSGNSGGSYGIGKYAPFIASAIQTICYSTMYENPKRTEYFISKAILAAHKDPHSSGEMLQNVGFGTNTQVRKGSQAPAVTDDDIDGCFRLENAGTGIFIMGFEPPVVQWKQGAIKSVAENFFAAIYEKKLTVTTNGTNMDNNTIKDVLIKVNSTDRPVYYYETLTNPTRKETVAEDDMKFIIKYMVGSEDMPNRIAYINRKGMIITDSKMSKENPFAVNLGNYTSYVAVIQAADDTTDKTIRKMEPPSHNAINPTRIQSEKKRKAMKKKLNTIRGKINEILVEAVGGSTKENKTDADEVMEFFPVDMESGQLKIIIKPMPKEPGVGGITKNSSGSITGEGGKSREQKEKPEHGWDPPSEPLEPKPPRGPKSNITRRRFARKGGRLQMYFDNNATKKIALTLRLAGEYDDGHKDLKITDAAIISPASLKGSVLENNSIIIPPCNERITVNFGIPDNTPDGGYEIVEEIIEGDNEYNETKEHERQ